MKTQQYILLFVFFWTAVSCGQSKNETSTRNYTHEIAVPDLDIPWGFVFLPDHAMLITEKHGDLIHYKNGKKSSIKGLPKITILGQGGLMDIALHPNFKDNGWIYIAYASSEGEGSGANTAIMRFKLNDNTVVDKQILYKAGPNSRKGQHFGSRIVFDNEGFLYFSIGDRGNRDINPQNIERDCGKIYRLHDDGRIPVDNPFIKQRFAKKAIYSYGHRNPQGMTLHPQTGAIWTHEHGPRGGDEINIIKKGINYGWPKVSYGINYSGTKFTNHTSLPDMEQPLHHWTPSIAPSGMAFISSDIYPDWKGNLLVGSLKFMYLNRCVLQDNKVIKQEKLIEALGSVRSVKQGPDGYIYVGIENLGIVKIIPNK